MPASTGELARPTLRVRGFLGRSEVIHITGGRAVEQTVGKHLSESSREAEERLCDFGCRPRERVRFFGEVDASAASMRRVIQRIAGRFGLYAFCYEAGPDRLWSLSADPFVWPQMHRRRSVADPEEARRPGGDEPRDALSLAG